MAAPTQGDLKKLASRKVNHEFIMGLEVFDTNDSSMPGGFVITDAEPDPRLKHVVGSAKGGKRRIDFVRHVATVFHKPTNTVFVAFKETEDGLLNRQRDTDKYPIWLFDTLAKQAEKSIYIHVVKPGGIKKAKSGGVNQLDDWLDAIKDEWIFDSVAYFLMQNGIITEEMFNGIN